MNQLLTSGLQAPECDWWRNPGKEQFGIYSLKQGTRVLKTVAITATIINVLVTLFIKQLLCIDYMEHFKYIIIFLNHHISMKSETKRDSIFVEWTCMKMDEECSAFTIIRHTEFPKSVPC